MWEVLFLLGNMLTFGLLNVLAGNSMDAVLLEVDEYVHRQNELVYLPAGLRILDLDSTALQHVYIMLGTCFALANRLFRWRL